MVLSGAALLAAVCRALGLRAELTPASDARTLELGGRLTSGDECFPAQVTVGDFFRVLERPGLDPSTVVFLMPTTEGPCRFGQYAPYLRHLLDSSGYEAVCILSPTTANSYSDAGELGSAFLRSGWRVMVVSDILENLLLKYRPRESRRGDAETVHAECLDDLCRVIEATPASASIQMRALVGALVRCRDRFRAIPVRRDVPMPLIGVVGEIFCRLHPFSNQDVIRRVEALGGEVCLSGVAEWMWYTMAFELAQLELIGRRYSLASLRARLRWFVQHRDERRLMAPFAGEFAGREEPEVHALLEDARPYLPWDGALGEMVLSVGKAVHLAKNGAAGILDISPFTCMNGIVSEAVYPSVSRDHHGIPIKSLYFDGTQVDLDRDLDLFMVLVRSYEERRGRPVGERQPATAAERKQLTRPEPLAE
jgi:predicted nucleotide-binding protein (sugar kinase/HSP70/actin superfamily)